MMSLIERKTHKPRSKRTIPEDFNLFQDESSDITMIPVGYRQEKNELQIGSNKNAKIFYHNCPLELGFALTVWKVQGLTFNKVILWSYQLKGIICWTTENF